MEETSNSSTASSTSVLVQANSYEQVVKKLIQILQFRPSDNLKQLEDLWESVNPCSNPTIEPPLPSSHKRALPNLSSSSPLTQDAKRQKLIPQKTSTNPNTQKLSQSLKNTKTNKIRIETSDQSSSSSSTSSSSYDNSNLRTNLTEFDAEMLDFSCFICKQLNQELNNKLIECKKCTKLYHQMCHSPRIDQSMMQAGSDDKMVWYFDKCRSCSCSGIRFDSDEDEMTRMGESTIKIPAKGLAGLANKFGSANVARSKFRVSEALVDSNSNSEPRRVPPFAKFSSSSLPNTSPPKSRNIFNLNGSLANQKSLTTANKK